ncbi:MAG: PaaI family thioesterase [Alphaproteobacteria bacterium]|nr:PaaI family thioesterase [Alphaproteobacteria bacterium]
MDKHLTIADMQALINQSRFHQLFQPEVQDVDYDRLQLIIKMAMSDHFERQPGTDQWHGGTISAIIDIAGCYCLSLLAGEPLPTINFRADYLRPAVGTDLTAIARIRRAGRTVGVVDVDVEDDNQRLVAVGRACFSIQKRPPAAATNSEG